MKKMLIINDEVQHHEMTTQNNTGAFQIIPLEQIRYRSQTRKRINQATLLELAASIKQIGVAQPILVRPVMDDADPNIRFEIVAGERRYRASVIAEMIGIPAMVRELTDGQALELQITENLQRENVHPLEEAEGYEQLMKLYGFTADQLAEKVGKSRAYIYARLKLGALVPEAREAFYEDKLTPSTALLIARIPVKDHQAEAVKEITSDRHHAMSTRDVQLHIQRNYMLELKNAAFKPADTSLIPAAGSCNDCPKRTGNQPLIFSDIDGADICTDSVCFGKKRNIHHERVKQAATASGKKVISGQEAKKIKKNSWSNELDGGYVALDAKCYADPEYRTYREILGANAPETTLLENPHKDELIDIVAASDILSILKSKGIKLPNLGKNNSAGDEQKKLEAKVKIEKEYRRRLFTAVREKSNSALGKEDLRAIAFFMLSNCPDRPFILQLYSWDKSVDEHPNREDKLRTAIAKLDGQQAAQIILDCTLIYDLDVNTYNVERSEPAALLAAAKRAHINPDPIKAAVQAEAKAQLDAKKKKTEKPKSPGKKTKATAVTK